MFTESNFMSLEPRTIFFALHVAIWLVVISDTRKIVPFHAKGRRFNYQGICFTVEFYIAWQRLTELMRI